jgi:cobalt/nickel transport system permease protein
MLYSPAPAPDLLHIPDGMLSVAISLLMWALTAVILGVALRRVNTALDERQIPLMGIMAAFIYAAQMINFPVAGGTSGHLLGGALAAVVLGPWAGMVTMAAVVIVQGLIFQDGGLLVMGANVLNMGLLTVMIGYGLYRGVAGRSQGARWAVAGGAAWLSVMAAALATSLQLWLSGTARLDIVMPAMLGVHALIGVGEALITVAALAFVVLSPLASANPDGLERVAIDLGFIDRSASAPFELLPDYTLPFLGETSLSTIAAGFIGVLLVAGVAVLIVRLVRRARPVPNERVNIPR